MECTICFHEALRFKVLQCDHAFCEQCTKDLAARKYLANGAENDLKRQNGANGEHSQVNGTQPIANNEEILEWIECPQCRRITKLNDGRTAELRTKFYGRILCTRCDERKCVDEFRWCDTCSTSVCSRCFVDKHVYLSEEGQVLGMHAATKWDDGFPAVRFCLEQLRLEADSVDEGASKSKEYVHSYLEGLQEYICAEIQTKSKQSKNDILQKLQTLGEAYNMDPKVIKTSETSNHAYESLLPTLYELCGLGKPAPCKKATYKFNSVPYKDLSKVLLSPEKVSTDAVMNCFDLQQLKQKLSGETVIIGANMISQPMGFCIVPNKDNSKKNLLISDYENGLFLFNAHSAKLQGPLLLKLNFAKFGYMAQVPKLEQQPAAGKKATSVFMINCQFHHNHNHGAWVYILLPICEETSQTMEPIKNVNSNHPNYFSLPGKENWQTCSSERVLYALSNSQKLWRYEQGNTGETRWKDLQYAVVPNAHPSHNQVPCKIGPIVDCKDHTKLYLANGAWQSVDIVTFGYPDDKLWSVQRVELSTIFGTDTSQLKSVGKFLEPALFSCMRNEEKADERMILVDTKKTKVFLWEKRGEKVYQLADYAMKTVQEFLYANGDTVFMITQHKENGGLRSLEMVNL